MFKNIRVGTRLISSFLFISVLGAIVGGMGILNMSRIDDMAKRLYDHELLGLSYIKEANISLVYVGRARGNVLLATTEEERQKNVANIKKYMADVHNYLTKAKSLFVTDKAKELFAQYDKVSVLYEAEMAKVLSLAANEKLADRGQELNQMLVQVREHANTLDDVLSDLASQKEARAKAAAEESSALYESSRLYMILLVVCSTLIGVAIGIFITRSIVRPMQEAVKVAKTVASGDLTSRIDVTSTDETGQLLQALKDMNNALINIVGEVRSGTETIASASEQIASGNADLSSRTEEQASSLEETASSMEELTSTVKQNADNARQANQLAVSASEVAEKGGAVVSEVVQTMGSINDSAKKIVDIIGVIDGIAFQTNILALNAAVEAARAGEQGRGFAVVASEVRNLAQRSAAAAKEIKALIDNSVEKVDAGSRLVDQAGTTMQEVVDSIKRVTDIMAEISAASQEQTAGIEQVQQAVTQMDQATQQNAALVEEAAAASDAMRDQAQSLTQLVSVFKLNGGDAKTSAQPAKPKAAVVPLSKKSPAAVYTPADPLQVKRLANAGSGNDWAEF